MLRFIVREPLAADIESQDRSTPWTQDPERYQQLISNMSSPTATQGINTVFREAYGIDFQRLLTGRNPKFFLCFIPAGCEGYEEDSGRRQTIRLKTSEEHDLVAEFLRENGAEVFSLQDVGSYEASMKGSWDYFSKISVPFWKE